MTSIWDASAVPQSDTGQGPPPEECDVVVIGAGVVGVSAAVRLARAGRRVAVIADGEPGGGTTGRSTGKLTLLQGTRLSQVRHGASEAVAAAYLEAGRVGLDWLAALGLPQGDAWRTAPAYTAATTEEGGGEGAGGVRDRERARTPGAAGGCLGVALPGRAGRAARRAGHGRPDGARRTARPGGDGRRGGLRHEVPSDPGGGRRRSRPPHHRARGGAGRPRDRRDRPCT